MKTVIFGGTSEGRELSRALAKAGADVVVSVVSDVGAEEQGEFDGVLVEVGPKEEDGIRAMIPRRGSGHRRDASLRGHRDGQHPQRGGREGVERLRLLRDESRRTSGEARGSG